MALTGTERIRDIPADEYPPFLILAKYGDFFCGHLAYSGLPAISGPNKLDVMKIPREFVYLDASISPAL